MALALVERTRHTDWVGLGVLALRVVLAGGKPTIAPHLCHQITIAFGTLEIELNRFGFFFQWPRKLAFGIRRTRQELAVAPPLLDEFATALLTGEISNLLKLALYSVLFSSM